MMKSELSILTFRFRDSGDIPNHPHLPLLVYRNAVDFRGADAHLGAGAMRFVGEDGKLNAVTVG